MNPLFFLHIYSSETALAAFDDQPIAFSMDWGLTSTHQTLLVEINDGFALGNYGLDGMIYTAMIEARWRQLLGLPDNGIGEHIRP